MSEFEKLVSEQMKIMDQLLELQSELDRCRQVEAELISLERDAKLDNVQDEIATKRKDLPAYRSYSKGRQSKSSSLIAARKSRLPMCRNECAIPEAEWFFYFHF